ncbi:MAG: sigma-70 family polymerase sigma factor [Ilumatobacteraceae bacterium]|nr:sigma-70 family polymerase sigma factor [Ilumatobacteraceae bacterium]
MAKHNEDVVSITRAIRANRIARAQGAAGPQPLSRPEDTVEPRDTSDERPDARRDDQSGSEFGVDDLEPGIFGSPASIERAVAGTNPLAKQLVEDHLWLVDRLAGQAARRFPRYVERNELWSAGVLGLVEAARRYDSSYNVPFAAYASARVRGEMLETARSADLAPRRLRRSLRELAEVVENLTQTLGRVPSLAEVAEAAQIDVAVVRDRLQTASNLVSSSLDDSAGSSSSDHALATVATEPTEKLSQQELLGALREAVSELPEPLKSVLVRSHWNNERLVDIAEDMGISFQRVAQYKVEAITALAAWFATLYEAVPTPDAGLPGAVRRAAFCSSLAARSTWRTRLAAGAAQREQLAEALSGLGAGGSDDS